jgi:hypothetical protein
MSKKNRDEEKVIMRHILELRLKKRFFSFMDFRGRMVEFMTNELGSNQIKLLNNGSRFDMADDKLENLYFFSLENLGFQSELKSSFDDFSASVKKLIDALKKFTDYKIDDGFVRIGTKSIILYHRRFDNSQSIKDAYKILLVNNTTKLSELTKSSIIDTAHIFDLKLEKSKANVLTGPVTKDEALAKFFEGKIKEEYDKRFSKDNGMLLAIDVSGDNPSIIKNYDDLEKQINTQIDDIKVVFDGFKGLFDNTQQ